MNNKLLAIILPLLLCCASAWGQTDTLPSIQMRGEVGNGLVMVRWAPTDAKAWRLMNRDGVRLERLTVFRNGSVLDEPEVALLAECLKPEESDEFKKVAEEYPFGAVIAQAIFGESFEIEDGNGSEIESIIALSEEQQQRYVFAMYAADLCFPAAIVAGWGWEDRNIVPNERYLYRITPLTPAEEYPIAAGALFIDPARKESFPKPLDFSAAFGDGSVKLGWNYRILETIYNAYMLERSTDGVNFEPVSDIPITQIGESSDGLVTYIDTISNSEKYYYRLIGLTPFGTRGEYSDVVSGIGIPEISAPPFITKAIPTEDGNIDIEWQVAEEDEDYIVNFVLEHSPNDKTYMPLVDSIGRRERSLTVKEVSPSNYFVVAANTISGKVKRSLPAFVQAIDSIPPAVPQGLQALIDTTGVVRLSWNANKDADIYGYRIFKAQNEEEELIPMNDIAVKDTVFMDSVNLRMLNANVYYAVAALDQRYNQSDKTPILKVEKPEVIPPTPPLIKQIIAENGVNIVVWVSGRESRLIGYEVHRLRDGDEAFEVVAVIEGADLCRYEDRDIENNRKYTYQIKSRTSKLLSEPSLDYPIEAIKKDMVAKSAIELALTAQKGCIKLKWKNIPVDAIAIMLYKKTDEGPLELFRDMADMPSGIDDTNVVPGVKYTYMLVVKTNSTAPQTVTKSMTL